MKRIAITPRHNWESKIRKQGFVFYENYYNENSAYEFTASEIDLIDLASIELFDRCLDVVQHVIDNRLWDEFFIPRQFAELIKWSWENDNPSFYGRFDLGVSKDCSQIKLLEFNADTPTSLLEASVIQWHWLQDVAQHKDQFNSIHEKLVSHIKVCNEYLYGNRKLYFSCARNSDEDFMTVKYLEDIALQAGISTHFLFIDEVSVKSGVQKSPFVTPSGEPINNIFKLYPYDWLFHETFASELVDKRDLTLWIEPPYKAILSNKMLLVYLYKLFPNHTNILPAYYSRTGENSKSMLSYVCKPVYGREGSNVSIVRNQTILEQTGGEYGEEGFVLQEYFEIAKFDGNTPVIGSWLIGGETAGLGIKETKGLIHNNMSMFVPHYF